MWVADFLTWIGATALILLGQWLSYKEQERMHAQTQQLFLDTYTHMQSLVSVYHTNELEAIETLHAVVTQTDARVLGFTHLKPDVVRVEVEKIVTVPGPTSVRSGTQKVTFPPTHIVFMDADEKNIHDVVQIPVRQRSQILEFEGSRYECTAGSPELGYFIYRHMTR